MEENPMLPGRTPQVAGPTPTLHTWHQNLKGNPHRTDPLTFLLPVRLDLQEQQLPEPLAGAAVAVRRWDRARREIVRQGANRRRRDYKNNPGSGPRSSCC
jgi:hypothetical protein